MTSIEDIFQAKYAFYRIISYLCISSKLKYGKDIIKQIILNQQEFISQVKLLPRKISIEEMVIMYL